MRSSISKSLILRLRLGLTARVPLAILVKDTSCRPISNFSTKRDPIFVLFKLKRSTLQATAGSTSICGKKEFTALVDTPETPRCGNPKPQSKKKIKKKFLLEIHSFRELA